MYFFRVALYSSIGTVGSITFIYLTFLALKMSLLTKKKIKEYVEYFKLPVCLR